MINVADLPAVHVQAAKAKAEDASPALAAEPPEPPPQGKQSTISLKPTLALDKGRYYVVENKK